MDFLLAHTSMESNVVDEPRGDRPRRAPARRWGSREVDLRVGAFRLDVLERRLQHRFDEVADRIHILDGRMIAFLNIDKVIKVIRNSDEPKPDLIKAFKLSERQAEDILEIRLRQLARLEGIKIERELAELKKEQSSLKKLLGSPAERRKLAAAGSARGRRALRRQAPHLHRGSRAHHRLDGGDRGRRAGDGAPLAQRVPALALRPRHRPRRAHVEGRRRAARDRRDAHRAADRRSWAPTAASTTSRPRSCPAARATACPVSSLAETQGTADRGPHLRRRPRRPCSSARAAATRCARSSRASSPRQRAGKQFVSRGRRRVARGRRPPRSRRREGSRRALGRGAPARLPARGSERASQRRARRDGDQAARGRDDAGPPRRRRRASRSPPSAAATSASRSRLTPSRPRALSRQPRAHRPRAPAEVQARRRIRGLG